MSLAQFQEALALLIHNPSENYGNEMSPFLDRFDLNERERDSLIKLSSSYEVRKFGRNQRQIRFSDVARRGTYLTRRYIPKRALEHIYNTLFEPRNPKTPLRQLPFEFLRFLRKSKDAHYVLSECGPDFIFDCIEFEFARLLLMNHGPGDFPVKTGSSLLNHKGFVVLGLKYDIPKLFTAVMKLPLDEKTYPEPDKKEHTLLFIAKEGFHPPRYFEVSQEMGDFLNQLREDKQIQSLPESYEDLVSIGLCRAAEEGNTP